MRDNKVSKIRHELKKLASTPTFKAERKALEKKLLRERALASVGYKGSSQKVKKIDRQIDLLDLKYSKQRQSKLRLLSDIGVGAYGALVGGVVGSLYTGARSPKKALAGAAIGALALPLINRSSVEKAFKHTQKDLLSRLANNKGTEKRAGLNPIFIKEKSLLKKQDQIIAGSILGVKDSVKSYKNVEEQLDKLYIDNTNKFWDREKLKGSALGVIGGAGVGAQFGFLSNVLKHLSDPLPKDSLTDVVKNITKINPRILIGTGVGALGLGYLNYLKNKSYFKNKQKERQGRINKQGLKKTAATTSKSLGQLIKELSISLGELIGKGARASGQAAGTVGKIMEKNPEYVIPTGLSAYLALKYLENTNNR